MRGKSQATETLNLQQAAQTVEDSANWIRTILARVQSVTPLKPNSRVLDVGAAQGQKVIALKRLGFDAYGVEPVLDACETAKQLGQEVGITIDIRAGRAEHIPFDDEFFDLVIATTVIEHVSDLEMSFAEIARVLKPGGTFWFSTVSSMCPFQGEIGGFPLFGWYPDSLKLKVMAWAQKNRPELIGHTETPAIHWFTPWKARRKLNDAGFGNIWDRWQLRQPEECGWLGGLIVSLARRNAVIRLVGDVIVRDCSYAARKP